MANTAFCAALKNCGPIIESSEDYDAVVAQNSAVPHFSRLFLDNSRDVLAYLCFPLLEATVKRACSKFVDLNGKVVAEFEIDGKYGLKKYFPVKGRGAKTQCSSLRDLLVLHDSNCCSQLRAWLESLTDHLQTIAPDADAYDTIYA